MADVCGTKSEWKQWFGACVNSNGEGGEFSEASTCSCNGDQPDGDGWMRETGVKIYSGPMKNGQKKGFGWLRMRGGMQYTGEFEADLRSGEGALNMAVGTLTGQFKEDKPHGLGVSVDSTDQVYSGRYVNGKREGHGVFEMGRVGTYYGEFKGGVRSGCGVLERGNGIEVMLQALLLGKTRQGVWAPCDRRKECLSGIYCKCDVDATQLLSSSPKHAACVAEAKRRALEVREEARAVEARILARVGSTRVWAGADAPFLNITEEQQRMIRTPVYAQGDEEERDEDQMGASMTADLIALTSLLSLFQLLKQMFEGTPKMRGVWALLGCGMVALYERSIGFAYSWHALVVTYKVMTGAEIDELENITAAAFSPGTHSEL
eukprot:CAMPEP_0181310210 /NCGR_PEP_ID=MMETSP1101-20121128/12462_1 /TAXON_ID=46948 /ORGANISM="Rhodomonas abbreviata, Strain Caron Lab Isolate" /LENGTH=376 /DNA_ID=CAMNT_0023416819 /DNA_START=99 /DNA_END=1229 /DNA_ORIENTATION=+